MNRFVVDNSVVMAWCFEDEADNYAESVLNALAGASAIVPAIWPLEAGNVLLAAERRKRLKKSDTSRFLEIFDNLPILVEQETPGRMLSEILILARDTGLSTYDASYLDLALRKGIPLATRNAKLRAAAKKCGVMLFV